MGAQVSAPLVAKESKRKERDKKQREEGNALHEKERDYVNSSEWYIESSE